MSKSGTLFVIPSFIGSRDPEKVFPKEHAQLLRKITCWVVENAKAFRKFLKDSGIEAPYDHLLVIENHKHAEANALDEAEAQLMNGNDVALVSDAGAPGIADPGKSLVARAHNANCKVVPVVGPSSISLALMASGLHGQQFHFLGYLPVKEPALRAFLRNLQHQSLDECTYICIETPYRNQKMLAALIKFLNPTSRLCVAMDITGEEEWIRTQTIEKWKSWEGTLAKNPAVFLWQY